MLRRTSACAVTTVMLIAGLIGAAAPASAVSCTSPKVVYHTLIKNRGNTVGYVDLEYSVACHSARAHVHSIYKAHPYDTHGAYGQIYRTTGSTEKHCYVAENKQDCTTGWIYDKDPYKAKAYGSIDMYPVNYDLAKATTPAY